MLLSILIPTFNRAAKLAACLSALSQQTLPGDYEVLVGIDGPDSETEPAARRGWNVHNDRLHIFQLPKQGQASIRNQLLKHARGRTLIFLNDDMVPDRGFLEAHLKHQQAQQQKGRAALIIGDSPWARHQPDSLFHRLIRETSMVFFYNTMQNKDPDHDWGFRHAWLLNLSAPAALVREIGGFTVFPSTYGYEDDELAWRLHQRFNTPVLFRPDAIATHDHRLTPTEYLKREYQLGFSAWGFARTTPECALAMFRRDITSREELDYSRAVIEREARSVERIEQSFRKLADLPAATINGPDAHTLLDYLYEHHLPLKRYHWRRGLLAAASESSR
jgi:glycosyltransferase involved in cell wall biosynthesis